nr:DMT family transporter [Synechococcus sp. PCC 6312]
MMIFGLSNPVTRKLTELGAENLIDGRNPVSLCNILFVGNLCAIPMLGWLYWQELHCNIWRQLSRQQWVYLILVAILAGAVAPAVIFQALELTNVSNVILIGRLEPPLTLGLSVWWLKEKIHFWDITGAGLAVIGTTLTLLLQAPTPGMMHIGSFHIGAGELLAMMGALALAVATILGRQYLAQVTVGVYSLFRTVLGSVIFLFTALYLYGAVHFMDVLSPFLWQWMLFYGAVIVVAGQLLWIWGLESNGIVAASLVASFTPIFGILAAYVFLGETPTSAQYLGGGIIFLGVCLGQMGLRRQLSLEAKAMTTHSLPIKQRLENQVGFKGF